MNAAGGVQSPLSLTATPPIDDGCLFIMAGDESARGCRWRRVKMLCCGLCSRGLGMFLLTLSTLAATANGSGARALGELAPDTDEYTMAYVNLTYKDPRTGALMSRKEEIGKYGFGRVEEARGLVVRVRSRNGTEFHGCDLPYDEVPPKSAGHWVALIKRGHCSYGKKIANAEGMNASAVVVYDDRPGPLLKMNNHREPNVVAVFIAQVNGEEIAGLLDNGTAVEMVLSAGTHHSVRYATINRTSVLFVSISFIILMIISLAWLVFYYVQRFRYIHAKDKLAKRLCNAAQKALSKIPVRTIKNGDKESHGEVECCAVCIEPYKILDVVRMLPCKHQFHRSCVDPWLLEQQTCPMCKMDILKFYGLMFTGSHESILHIEIDENAFGRVVSRNSADNNRANASALEGSNVLDVRTCYSSTENSSIPYSSDTDVAHACSCPCSNEKQDSPVHVAQSCSDLNHGQGEHHAEGCLLRGHLPEKSVQTGDCVETQTTPCHKNGLT